MKRQTPVSEPILDHPAPSPELFDEAFERVAEGNSTNVLIDEVLGPFPAHVEPSSSVPREGLDRVLSELQLEPGDHLVRSAVRDPTLGPADHGMTTNLQEGRRR